ncbi:MAG TPA: UTP--glucose-1-phosphate uridylyltransferase GalU [Candidatus Limnocylindrales bacterium]|nr:UTP--glucose-1-phosphate uridylyltransferase GalU [Candidatus Limnocylindrales bacterium]
MKIRKAVFPAAGLGTRFLPATKAQPKEMLPVVDKPTIQYVVEEAVEAGIEDIVIITGRGKRAIEDHFDISFELEYNLHNKGKIEELNEIRHISEMLTVCYVRQKQPLGLGHAILTAKDIIGEEPFAVLLGDDIIYSKSPCIKQLIEVHNRYNCSVVAVRRVDKKEVQSYGIIDAKEIEPRIYRVLDMIEKPVPEEAPSNLAIMGRYILTPEIFDVLAEVKPDQRGEIQLTDGLKALLSKQVIYGYEFEGIRYDIGNKLGFLTATVEFALRRADLGDDFRKYLQSLDLNKSWIESV